MRVRSTAVVAAVFGAAALLAAFVVARVMNARRDLPAGAEPPPKGIARLAKEPGSAGSGWLSGRVGAEAGPLPTGTSVFAQRSGGAKEALARAEVSADGRYRLGLPEGEYRVWAAPPGAEGRARPAFATVARGETAALDLAVPPAPAVALLVVEPDGSPSRGAVVTLARPGDAKLALATTAGDDGRVGVFAEMGLAGSALEVRARNGGRTGSWTGVLPGAGVVPVRLAPAGSVQVTLVGRGKPPGALVVSVSSRPAPQAWRTLAEHRFPGSRFELADLPPEHLRLSVKTDDGRRGSAELSLAPGESRAVQIALVGSR